MGKELPDLGLSLLISVPEVTVLGLLECEDMHGVNATKEIPVTVLLITSISASYFANDLSLGL